MLPSTLLFPLTYLKLKSSYFVRTNILNQFSETLENGPKFFRNIPKTTQIMVIVVFYTVKCSTWLFKLDIKKSFSA